MLNFEEIKQRMDKITDLFVNDIGSLRTGRATPGLIENIVVTAYGQKMRLQELGSIGTPDARSLTFQPWDQALLREISNGIAAANVGINPVVDGQLLRISLPMMTTEQREEFAKLLGRKLEGVREMVRGTRADYRKKLMDGKNDKSVSEDVFKRDEAELQKLTDLYITKLEEIAKKKEVEIRG